jgi:hypothetical protein
MKSENYESCLAQRDTSRHRTTAEQGGALPHVKGRVHQEAPAGKVAELVGFGKKTTTNLKSLANSSQEQEGIGKI